MFSNFKTNIMKKFQKIIVALVVVISFAYAGSAMNSEEAVVLINSNETTPVIENVEFTYENSAFITPEEALYCKVTDGKKTLKCWFCNCSELAEEL